MRIQSSVISISWIPSEAIPGLTKLPFEMGQAHYDPPPPEVIDDLEALRGADRFRFANELKAWIEVEDGKITGYGQEGQGHIGVTNIRLGPKGVSVAAVPLPDRRPDPEVHDDRVRFVQTAGGRTGVPMPRAVKRPPFFQVKAPVAWTTLALTIFADGRSEHEVVGASPFPRHWIYDHQGKLAHKSGTIEFREWKEAFGKKTPWGKEDSPAIVAEAESALERELSQIIMSGRKPKFQKVKKGKVLTEQGSPGDELYLLLDGILDVEMDGEVVAQVGPGAVLGEMAVLEGGQRIATLKAATDARVAVVSGDVIDRKALRELSAGRSREERGSAGNGSGGTGVDPGVRPRVP